MKNNILTEEEANRLLMKKMWVILVIALACYLGTIYFAISTYEEGVLLGTIVTISTLVFVGACFYALKLEVEAGYYECRNCHNRYKPTYFQALMAPHINTTRYMKCPECQKRSWSRKVMTKE